MKFIKLPYRSFLFTAILASISLIAHGQFTFQKTYGGSNLDWSNSIEQLNDSSFILIASTRSFGSGMQDINFLKTNNQGDILWSKTFGDSTEDEEGTIVRTTIDGGYMIAGTSFSFGSGNGDMYLVKLDGNGDLQWSKTFGGSTIDFCTGAQQCFDGGYIVSGYTSSFGTGGNDLYMIRTDSVGDTLWTRTYGTVNIDQGYGLLQLSDSGFIMTGYTTVGGQKDVCLVKIDNAGNILWTKVFGGIAEDIGYSVIQATDGGFCIAGTTLSFGVGSMDAYLVKTDMNGDPLWAQTFGTSDSDGVFVLRQTADDGYVMTGFASKSGGVGDDILVLKTDSAGQMMWSKVIGGGSNARDNGRSVTNTLDGGFAISGFSQSFGGGTDLFLMKTDPFGNSGCNEKNVLITSNSALTISTAVTFQSEANTIVGNPATIQDLGGATMNTLCFVVGLNETNQNLYQSAVYPNPFHASARIVLNGNISFEPVCTLFDIEGREIKTLTNYSTGNDAVVFEVESKGLTPGLYFYRISSKASILDSGKLVVE